MAVRIPRAALACLLALGLAFGAAGCQKKHKAGEPLREGLDVLVGGVDFNVFITRQLNIKDPEDSGYYSGPEAPPGSALYGVFVEVCNHGKHAAQAADTFTIVDTQGNEFKPLELPRDNLFAYRSRRLAPGDCIPTPGSIPATAPTSGSLVLFKLPLTATENRPLELEIDGADAATGKPARGRVELDI
jgi:hypothetical protein